MTQTYIALLRGVNVGGKNRLPMAGLVEICCAAGCLEVRTYIQSGNIVFRAAPSAAVGRAEAISAGIAGRFGFRPPVVLRSADEMDAILHANPFVDAGMPEERLHVLFLKDTPDSARITALDSQRSTPDTFAVQGRNIYLYLPNGAGQTKLTNAYFDAKLATIGTSRNWRTVAKLAEMARDL
jgi:uncharacterized protein (DUF1697 family)